MYVDQMSARAIQNAPVPVPQSKAPSIARALRFVYTATRGFQEKQSPRLLSYHVMPTPPEPPSHTQTQSPTMTKAKRALCVPPLPLSEVNEACTRRVVGMCPATVRTNRIASAVARRRRHRRR